jgi:O-antigen/teichoic acid export membrane protein
MIANGGATVVGNAILVSLGHSVVTIIIWNLAVNTSACIAFFLIARRLLPGIRPVWRVRKSLVYELLKFSGAVTAYQLIGNALVLFERSWLTRTLGAAAVTYYVVPMTIAAYIHSFVSSFSIVLFPLASEANALGNKSRLEELYAKALKYVGVMVVFFAITLSVGSWQFMSNWMGIQFAEKSAALLQLQAITFGLMAMMVVPWQIADGLGCPIYNVMLNLWWLAVSMALGIWLTPIIGLKGFMIGRLVSMVGIPVYIYFLHRRVFGKPFFYIWNKILPPLLIAGCIAGLVQMLLYTRLQRGWFQFGIATALGGLVFLGVLMLMNYINYEERRQLQRFFQKA